MTSPHHDLALLLRAHGGIASSRELSLPPTALRALARAVSREQIVRARPGVYAVQDAPLAVIRAAAIGGRVTGVSALLHHGLWTPPGPYHPSRALLHVEVDGRVRVRHELAKRYRARLTWSTRECEPRFGVAPLGAMLEQCARELPLPLAVAVLDSALRCTPLTPVELALLAHDWRPRARAAATCVDERSESGTESVLRTLLLEAGIPSTPQPPLPIGDHERADLLIGDRLLIECDSEAHHADPESRRADLARDALLATFGFIVLRFDYRQVFDAPHDVVGTVTAAVGRGDHLSQGSVFRF